jgi:GTP:adenosylcobinamide-phosphate guanylyltransferase
MKPERAPVGTMTALILAGRRGNTLDPLAAAAGVSHKCVVPIAGRPMIAHVLDTLAASDAIRAIIVSVDDVAMLQGVPEVRRLIESGMLRLVQAEPNLVDSIVAAAEDAAFPLLVTTADNVLLDAASVSAIHRDARRASADIAVAFARREAVLAAHPDGQRRFYRFSDGAYSNCNSYWIGSRDALKAAEVFRQGGQFAKHPLRIVHAFGLMNLIRFRFGIGSLDAAFRRFSRRFRLAVRAAIFDNGGVAIDVDNERTHDIAEQLLRERAALQITAAAE